MEIVEDVNIFPTEVQEAIVSQQNQEDQISNLQNDSQEIILPKTETQPKESNGNQSNVNENIIQPEENSLIDSVLDKAQKLANCTDIQNDKYQSDFKRQTRTCPQTAQKHPVFYKKTVNIAKPKTTSSKSSLLTMKRGKISSLSADKYLPKELINNPIIAKKYGVYQAKEIIARPPRAALDPRQYNPRTPVELGSLAQSILDGNVPDKEATKEELKTAKNQLKNLELELIDKADYMAAKQAASAFDYMENYISKHQDINKLKENLEGILSKRNELIAYISSIQESIRIQLEEQKAISEDRLRELESQQMIEIQEFDNNVPSELTREFKHQTKDYMELRNKQRSLAMKREFDEAQKLKEKADKLEQLQIKGDIKQMRKYYNRKRKLILNKHRIQIQCIIDDNTLREKEIINSRQFEIDATNARIMALDEEVKRKCEEKGVNMSDLDDGIIDQNRVNNLITRSNDTRYAKFRPRSNYYGSQYVTMKNPLPPLPVEA